MSESKNLMITLTDAEYQQLEELSFTLGFAKSRIISQALNMLKMAFNDGKEEKLDKNHQKGVRNGVD